MSTANPQYTLLPNYPDVFIDVVDENVIQQQTIVVPSAIPFQVQLSYVPKGPKRNMNGTVDPTTVYIQNFREIEGTPQQTGQYNVDYNVGMISFFPEDRGKTLIVQYKTAGDPITALQFNTIQDALVNLEDFFFHPYLVDADSVKWYLHVDTSGVITTSTTP